jgi:hypothetical protein
MNVTEAQTTTINQVGILSPWDANGEKDVWDAFKDGLTELSATPRGRALRLFPGSLTETLID